MKIQILVIFALSLIVLLGTISAATGDLNSDNKVDASDFLIVIKWILNVDRTNSASDVNGDGVVNIFDIVQVGVLLGKQYGNDTTAPIITAGKPNVNLSATATHAVLSVSTNERAICKHSTSSGTNYSSMTQFNKTGGIFHATNLTGLSNGTAYNYYVKCQDEAGNLNNTDYSISFNVGTVSQAPDTQAPTQPTNLQATVVSSSQISLTWTASTDNVAVTGYRIFRCTGANCNPTTQIETSASNSFSNPGLSSATTYVFAVSAYDAAGNNSTKSSNVSATTLNDSAYVTVASDDWQNYSNKADLIAAGGWTESGDAVVTLITNDTTFGKVARITQPVQPITDSAGNTVIYQKNIIPNLNKSWFRFKVKFSPNFTTASPYPSGAANSYKLVFVGWNGSNGRSEIEFTNTNGYFPGFDYGGNPTCTNILLGGSPASWGSTTTEWTDGEWWEYIMYYEKNVTETNYSQHRWWRREYTSNGAIVNNSFTYIGTTRQNCSSSTPPVRVVQLGGNKNKVTLVEQYIYWGPYEVVNGSRYSNPFGIIF